MAHWSTADIPDQTGRRVIVTGANSGIGLVAARELAARGAHVVLACRNAEKGAAAAAGMTGDVEVRALDVADLASVRAFADTVDTVDVLVNNAGVMATPKGRTADGFELQIGTNHLGPFALTLLLGDRITDRVVNVSSAAHQIGRIDLADLNWERRRYLRWPAYGQSKLANLLFTYELQRRHAAGTFRAQGFAAHPGFAATNLGQNSSPLMKVLITVGASTIGQSADMGALPTLMAAVADLPGGSYVGPGGIGEQRGFPTVVGSNKASHDTAVGQGLWALSTELVGL